MTSRGARSPNGPRITSVDLVVPRRHGRIIWLGLVFLAALTGTAASGQTAMGRTILAGLQRFMLFYAGVFALVALTAAVGIGLAATDRIVMVPSTRVVAQAVHRAVSLSALGFLVIHIVTEVLAHRSRAVDAFIPFLAQRRTAYIGLGTIASDLMVILIVTGLARSKFVGKWPWTWRAIHASAYLCWAMSILHGLLGGRTAKPYVDWSYGACVAAVLLALIIRLVATMRDRRETGAQPVRPSTPSSVPAAMSAMAPRQFQARRAAADTLPGRALRALPRALPAADADSSPAEVPGAYPGGLPRGSHRYQERAEPGAASYSRPGHPGSSAYAPGYASGPGRPYAPQPYAQQPYPGSPSGGQPGQPQLKHYAVVPLADYPEDAYQDDQYPDDSYPPDFSGPAPDLWPEHPSGPLQVYGLVSDPPEYLPRAEPERP